MWLTITAFGGCSAVAVTFAHQTSTAKPSVSFFLAFLSPPAALAADTVFHGNCVCICVCVRRIRAHSAMLTSVHSLRQQQQRGTSTAALLQPGLAVSSSSSSSSSSSLAASSLAITGVSASGLSYTGNSTTATSMAGQDDGNVDVQPQTGYNGEQQLNADAAADLQAASQRRSASAGATGRKRSTASTSRILSLSAEELRQQQLLAMQHEMWMNSRQLPNSSFKRWGMKPFHCSAVCGCRSCNGNGANCPVSRGAR